MEDLRTLAQTPRYSAWGGDMKKTSQWSGAYPRVQFHKSRPSMSHPMLFLVPGTDSRCPSALSRTAGRYGSTGSGSRSPRPPRAGPTAAGNWAKTVWRISPAGRRALRAVHRSAGNDGSSVGTDQDRLPVSPVGEPHDGGRVTKVVDISKDSLSAGSRQSTVHPVGSVHNVRQPPRDGWLSVPSNQ